MYTFEKGKYGLHHLGDIVEIEYHSVDIKPQELHFHIKRKAKWSYYHDFVKFSNSKKELRKVRKHLTSLT